MKRVFLSIVVFMMMVSWVHGASDFENLTVPAEGYYNGSDSAGQFASGDAVFANTYNASFESWEGFAYSTTTDTTTAGFDNQFSAITGAGALGSAAYAVAFTNGANIKSQAEFATPQTVSGIYVTNTTYAFLSMRDGDSFAKQFGGTTGDDPDFFKLTIKGYDNADALTGEVTFYLADYRFDDNSLDYIVDQWTWVDLTRLGDVAKLVFELDSSDVGQFGINTPAYFALDNLDGDTPITERFTFDDLTLPAEGYYNGSDSAGQFSSGDAVFANAYNADFGSWEGFACSATTDTTTAGFDNQFSAITGAGALGSAAYAVAFTNGANIKSQAEFATPQTVSGIYVTNTTYAFLSMRDGDSFAKQFGGTTGDDPDFFKLTIKGYDNADALTGEVTFYLADYRFDDNSLDYIVDQWTWVDLTRLGDVAKLVFELDSSDVGQFGMNTPAYFAMDGSETPEAPNNSSSGGSCFINTATSSQGTGMSVAHMATLFLASFGVIIVKRK